MLEPADANVPSLIVDHVAALAEGLEVARMVVRRIMVEMGRR